MSQVRAGIVVTGTEVLTARIVDRNGPWLSERLRELGFDVAHITICRDRPEDIRAQLEFMAAQDVELICTTGGLGPTADDATAAVVAEFCGREMIFDEALFARIQAIVAAFAARTNWDLAALEAGTRKQATVPAGAAILGPAGTAPGLVVKPSEPDRPLVVVLPGPPGELRPIWAEAVQTAEFRAVAGRGEVYEEQMLRMIGIPESEIARTLRDFEIEHGLGELEITTCLRKGEMEILVSHHPRERELRERLIAAFRAEYEGAIFSADGETIDEQVRRLLAGRTLALAESCTGGGLARRLTGPAGASAFFAGGAVTYSNDAKERVLGVPHDLLEERGAVSAEVAEAMARGALERFGADFAVAVTGIAGPAGGSDEKPVGTVYFHALGAEGASRGLHVLLPGRRGDIQERAITVALHVLRSILRPRED